MEGVQHNWRSGHPQQHPPAGHQRQYDGDQQRERCEKPHGVGEELGVVVCADRPEIDQHPGQHRVLDDPAVERPIRMDTAVDVGEDVFVHVAVEPELVDVGVAGQQSALVAAGEVGAATERVERLPTAADLDVIAP